MADIFISYCSADRDRVALLAHALEAEQLSVWWDRSLVPGVSFETEIDQALRNAKAVLVVWSQASARSLWVRSEAESARSANTLVPVKIETCQIPRPFDRLHTSDLTRWRGDRGNQGFPEAVEALRALVEGRAAKPIPWKHRITLAAVGAGIVGLVTFIAAITGIVDAAIRWSTSDTFAARSSAELVPDENIAPDTQEGFRRALGDLARSTDLRTQRALNSLEHGSRAEAIAALTSLARDQGSAIDAQMERTASLWRQVGLLQFNEQPTEARMALEEARRFSSNDVTTLTALGALYQREGRLDEAAQLYNIVLSQGALEPSEEARLRQVRGQALLDRGETEAAEREFLRAIELARSAVDDMLEADLMIDLGLVELDRGRHGEARARFSQARDFASAIGYPESVAYADFNTAEAWIGDANFTAADQLLREARQAAAQQGDAYLSLFVAVSFARLALRQGDYDRALSIAEGVRERASAQGMRRAEMEANLQIVEAQIRLRRFSDAERSAGEARNGWRVLRAENNASIASALGEIARSHDPARAPDACRALRSAPTHRGYAEREIQRLRSLSACRAGER